MRKGRDGEEKKTGGKKRGKKENTDANSGHYSLPAVDRPNADRWNAARSRQKLLPWFRGLLFPHRP